MFLHRIANALRRQDWAVIIIEFVMVISGVLIALQLDQWRESRAVDAREIKHLEAVREDIKRNIIDIGDAESALRTVTRFGYDALSTIATKQCASDCWLEVAAFFHASQWIDGRLNNTAYEEMKREGFPRDINLRDKLSIYHDLFVQTTLINAELPEYRELVRSIIPAHMQEHMWAYCFSFNGRNQTLIADCPPPKNLANVKETFDALTQNPRVELTLNFWLSTFSLVTLAMKKQEGQPDKIIADLTTYIDTH